MLIVTWDEVQVKYIPLLSHAEFHRLCGPSVNLIFMAFKNILNGFFFLMGGGGGGGGVGPDFPCRELQQSRSRFAAASMTRANLVPSQAVYVLWYVESYCI